MILLHVGYPKCASTHLQENLYKNQEHFCYLNHRHSSQLYELIYDENDRYTAEEGKELATKEAIPFLKKDKVNIISEERYTFNTVISIDAMADRLKFLFPDSKILIIIRNQFDILRSLYDMHPYSYFAEKRRWLSFDDWFSVHESNYQKSFIKGLHYDKTINKYSKLFGKENVHVVLFERLIKKENETIAAISELFNMKRDKFINCWEREMKNPAGIHWLYHLRLKYLPFIHLSKFLPKKALQLIAMKFKSNRKTALNSLQKDKIHKIYSEGNRRLETLLDVNLGIEGYPV